MFSRLPGCGVCTCRGFKTVVSGAAARARILAGVERLNDAVSATMGPKGRNVIIEQSWGANKITKDGVTVAKALEFQDKVENIGAKIMQEVAQKSDEFAGDGTTAATVLAAYVAKEVIRNSVAGRNPLQVRSGVMIAQGIVEKHLMEMSKKIDEPKLLHQVATISVNGDIELGKLVAQAVTSSQSSGAVTVKDGKTFADTFEHVQGMKFDKGFISPYFMTSKQGEPRSELKDALVLLYESRLSTVKQLLPTLELAQQSGRPLFIVCDDLEGDALSLLLLNRLKGGLTCCAVRAPGFGDQKKSLLDDIAIATGAKVYGDAQENIKIGDLGASGEITVTKDSFLLVGGRGSDSDIESRLENLKSELSREESEFEKDRLKERIARFSEGASIIHVGGQSEIEVAEKRDRVQDAVHATRAALQQGVVPGGGLALLRCESILENIPNNLNKDQIVGFKIVQRALSLPLRTIIKNCDLDPESYLSKIRSNSNKNYGFDAEVEECRDLYKAGIIDPVKVIVSSLRSGLNVASLVGTAEVVISEAPQKDDNDAKHASHAGMDY